MRAAVLTELGAPFVVEELELRAPGPHELVVRTEAAAFCITDCISARGALGRPVPPTILGHSAVGIVEEVGAGVTRVRPGDRVITPATPECGQCHWCTHERSDQCAELFVAPRHVADRADGTPVTAAGGGVASYAELMNLREVSVFPVRSALPADVLSLVGCGVISGLGAVFNAAGVPPGSSVAVVGAGHFGLWITQGARVAGAERIIAVEPRPDRRALAGTLGATDLVDPADGDPVEQVRALTDGRGVDYAFEAAGPAEAMLEAFHMTRNAGTVVLAGVESGDAQITFSAVMLAIRGRTIRSCQNGMARMTRDIPRVVRLIESGQVDAAPLITGRYALEDINLASEAAQARRDLSGVLVPGARAA